MPPWKKHCTNSISIIKGSVESFFDAYIESSIKSGSLALDWDEITVKLEKTIADDIAENLSKSAGKTFDVPYKLSGAFQDGDKLYDALTKSRDRDPQAGRAWFDWITTAVPKVGAPFSETLIENMCEEFSEALKSEDNDYGFVSTYVNDIVSLRQWQRFFDALSVADIKAWAEVGADMVLTDQANHDDITNKSQASFTSTELYLALKSVSLREHSALKALLKNNANAAYDSLFGPQNVKNPKLTSTEGIAAILSKIFTEYNTNLTALGAYKTLVNGNSDVMNYIKDNSKKQGGYPIVRDDEVDALIRLFIIVNVWKDNQKMYAIYF